MKKYDQVLIKYLCVLVLQQAYLLTMEVPTVFTFQDLQHFPRVQVKLKVQKSDTDGGTFSLNIKLAKMNSNRKTSRAFAPRFPKVKDSSIQIAFS